MPTLERVMDDFDVREEKDRLDKELLELQYRIINTKVNWATYEIKQYYNYLVTYLQANTMAEGVMDIIDILCKHELMDKEGMVKDARKDS